MIMLCVRMVYVVAIAVGLVCSASAIAEDVSRDQMEVAKKQAEESYRNYMASGKTDIAIDEFLKCTRVFEELSRDYTGDDKLTFRLHLGKLKTKAFENETAVKLFEEIERDGVVGSEERVESRTLLFDIRFKNETGDVKTGLDVLREAAQLEATNQNLYHVVQWEILQKLAIKDLLFRVGSANSVDERKLQLGKEIARLEDEMSEAGLPAEIVKLAQFGRVYLASAIEDFAMLHTALTELQPAIESPLIAPQWKALLWNKWVDQHIKQRNFSAALIAHRKLEEAAAQTEDVELIVISLSQKAFLYLRMGDYANARRLLEETRLFQLQNPNLEQSMNWRINMSKALEGDREFLQAREILVEALGILDRPEVSGDPQANALKINVLNNLGVSHYLTGELDRAAELLEKTRALIEQHSMSNHMIAAESMINLGWIELARKHPENSARFFKDAAKLVVSVATEDHVRFSEALAGAARAYLALGDRMRAAKLIRRAEELAYRKLIKDLQSIFDPRDRIAILQETRVHPESIAWPGIFDSYLELAVPLELPVIEQFDVVMRWKGVLNRLESASQRKQLYQGMAEVQGLENQLREVYFRRVSVLQNKKRLQEINSIETQLQNLRRTQSESHLAKPQMVSGGDTKSVLHSLKRDSALVSIVQFRTYRQPEANQAIGSSGEFVGFVANGGEITRVSLGEASELESAVTQWIKTITDQHPDERQAAQRVAKLVQSPLLPIIYGLDRLTIHADGVVHSLPWGALPGVGQSKFWIENIAFENVLDLKPAESNSKDLREPSLLVVGDVDYGPLSDSWPRLTATRGEILGVANTFRKKFPAGETASLTDIHADKPSVAEKIFGRRFVHFATHGLYLKRGDNDAFGLIDATSSLDTGLVLAASAKGQSPASQFLTASEVMAMDLGQMQLVVLSACETGLGKSKAGQGIDGLVFSFHSAGVEQVVSSLWQVRDSETKELMTRFYENLWQAGLSPSDALRKAQRDFFQNAELSQPIYWAAFTVSARGVSH